MDEITSASTLGKKWGIIMEIKKSIDVVYNHLSYLSTRALIDSLFVYDIR